MVIISSHLSLRRLWLQKVSVGLQAINTQLAELAANGLLRDQAPEAVATLVSGSSDLASAMAGAIYLQV